MLVAQFARKCLKIEKIDERNTVVGILLFRMTFIILFTLWWGYYGRGLR
jgi:hypothetical protein